MTNNSKHNSQTNKSGNMKAAVVNPSAKKEDIYQTVADLIAIENSGEVLRWQVRGLVLVILLKDGRKFYKQLEE